MPVTRGGSLEDGPMVKDHWAYSKDAMRVFKNAARVNGVIVNSETFPDIFGVERLTQYPGELEDAVRNIEDYARRRAERKLDALSYPEPVHTEAKTVVWTNVVTPRGVSLNVTAREGATRDMIMRTVLEMDAALQELEEEFGFTPSQSRR